ncbi:MAG: hypothetical protein ACK4IK_03470 [Bacteroidia bacterium]
MIKEFFRKSIAVKLSIILLAEIFFPVNLFALTGGPSQPEVESFEPIGTSDMVDLFSGDFTYNIPLLDVDGYPINISYHSGITMDQEASWVGLGWNINPGVINRAMRGLPDDFMGDKITKEFNMKPNKTWGLNRGGSISTEILGKKLGVGLSTSMGIKYNNYTGWGSSVSVTPSINAGDALKVNASLGISASSDDGASIQPYVGLNPSKLWQKVLNDNKGSLSMTIGGAYSARGGLSSLTIGTSYDRGDMGKVGGKIFNSLSNIKSNFNFTGFTYTPSGELNTKSFAITGKFSAGGQAGGAYVHGFYSGYFSSEKLEKNTVENPAYGYMYQEVAIGNSSLLDFNRENDGGFNEFTPTLSMPNHTYDLFSVSGQGIGGSYRPFRSDAGVVHDVEYRSKPDESYTLEIEVGVGAQSHYGGSTGATISKSHSGAWKEQNTAMESSRFKNKNLYPLYETIYFKEANEKNVESDPDFFNEMGGFNAVNIKLKEQSKYNVNTEAIWASTNNSINRNYRIAREKRNQFFSFLPNASSLHFVKPITSPVRPAHHIGEITTTGTDGTRYVYGLPAYNTKQVEATFAVGKPFGSGNGRAGDCATGLVDYMPVDNQAATNKLGIDNYVSKTTLPAYAHSYLLTYVLSSDYIDSDNISGPSDNDLGTYTKFTYDKTTDYKWRTPFNSLKASYNEGLKSDEHDDKASYIYGEKELYYLNKIETKNYVAIFTTSIRQDAIGVSGENGGAGNGRMQKLDKIELFSKKDLANSTQNNPAVPIKTVHFEYDYSLCPNIDNNTQQGSGKLTLKKIYFTYQNSNKAKFSPYEFTYSGVNPIYNIKAYDRWGNYKPNDAPTTCTSITSQFPNHDYPYSEQKESDANMYAEAWSLKEIKLPSGGKIKVYFEADDYAYVQNKKAMKMVKIIGVGNSNGGIVKTNAPDTLNLGSSPQNQRLYFELEPNTQWSDYYQEMPEVNGEKYLYFKVLAEIKGAVEYVPGYAAILNMGEQNIGGTNYGYVELKPVKLKDTGSTNFNAITKTIIQFSRLYLPRLVYNPAGVNESASLENIIKSMVNTFASLKELFTDPNTNLFNDNVGINIYSHKSIMRLCVPKGIKKGGGSRVKKIEISDEWDAMTGSYKSSYGQEYTYRLTNGHSSGVASYEPQIGGDENPLKQPVFYNVEKKFTPDDRFFKEEPIGESFFPSASVGYSRVEVKNLQYQNVKRHATGKVVHEFYTAKDFPTIASRTTLDQNNLKRHKPDKATIASILKLKSRDYLTASQGFVVETNDMHGKPKKQLVYQEGVEDPISGVEYKYKSEPYLNGSFRLKNEFVVVNPNGSVNNNARLGVFFDVVHDVKEQKSKMNFYDIAANVDVINIPLPPFVVPIPSVWPSRNTEETQFRAITTTKVIQRFGILEETVAFDLGSTVSTKTIAYDSETGEQVLTETITNFNDKVYTLNYPAYWYYEDMGPAYKNWGYSTALFFNNGVANVANAKTYFSEGDELIFNGTKLWVTEVGSSHIKAVNKNGNNALGQGNVTIIRSGRRNMQSNSMASITTLTNPLNTIKNNVYENVLQASAIEYSRGWKSSCNCFDEILISSTTNPYILGTKGNWRVKRSHAYLTERKQSHTNNNTNIRKDGVYASYSPFYKVNNSGKWEIDNNNWTFASEVTSFNPFGQEIENKDALERYSAASFGYNQTLPLAVASNARYKEIGFDGFEDYIFNPCRDDHFKFYAFYNSNITKTEAHTGSYSLKVNSNTSLAMTKDIIEDCLPVDNCNISLIKQQCNQGGTDCLYLLSGSSGYNISWNIISGNPQIIINPSNNNQVIIQIIENTALYNVIFEITDRFGCKLYKTVKTVSN